MITLATKDDTILPKAPPIITPSAISTILPLKANCLNSVIKLFALFFMFIIDLLSFEFTHNLAFFEINKRLIYLWAMIWIFLAFSSALFLGFYDISKKEALSKHAVVLVLFFCRSEEHTSELQSRPH